MPPKRPTADELKAQGNEHFKAGDFSKASKCYSDAQKLDPKSSVYPSNLSAALFEEGDYLSCISAIDRWWRLYRPADFEENPLGPDSRVSLRLAGRLAKALGHAVRNGSLSTLRLHDLRDTIAELRIVSAAVDGAPSLEWDVIDDVVGRHEKAAEARTRFSTLPIFRKSVKPYMTYFTIGQDPLMSLGRKSDTCFSLGGVGDARHVYSTLVGVHRFHRKLGKKRQTALRVHFTLLDIHPAALARDLCMLMLLNQVMGTPPQRAETRAEIFATMFYTFAGVVMPEYCHARLEGVMQELRKIFKDDVSKLPSWINVNSGAVHKMDAILKLWLTVPRQWSTESVLSMHAPSSPSDALAFLSSAGGVSADYKAHTEGRVASHRQKIEMMIGQMTPQQRRNSGFEPPPKTASAQAKKEFDAQKERMVDMMLANILNDDGNMWMERIWYEEFKSFVPPSELWSRHPGMENFKLLDSLDKTRVDRSGFGTGPDKPPNFQNLNSFEAPGQIDKFNHRMGISSTDSNDKPDAPAYTNFVDLFSKVADAVKALKNQVTLEILCGELTQELSKMLLGCDHTRPASFPRTYQRGHLSNIPDYTHGTLNKIIYALPVVEEASSNCFLNTGVWSNDDEFIHTYTLLKPSDINKYLGCRIISKDAMHGTVILRRQEQTPVPLSRLASRVELITWLTRVLLYTVLPSSAQQGPFRVRLPNNLVAFVALLMHLSSIGYPGHWLGEFLQNVLEGRLTTDIAPYAAKFPIPVSDMTRRVARRVVRLDPWVVELETILATGLHGITFHVSLPRKDFEVLSHTDIAMFEATVDSSDPWLAMSHMMGSNPQPVEDPVVCLLFYKTSLKLSANGVIARLPDLVNGGTRGQELCGSVFVLTALEAFDVPTVRWRISKARAARMREEGWMMVAYRADEAASITTPVPAAKWRDVSFDSAYLDGLDID
ncbi:hypothetical protein FB45DRAFT_945295 [Roridomyces roridus]|uniref:DUF4470 domain-containing protein n=1 Tax=Roridomyces roridus TaxID=1738132 RepID=A0AAD7B3P3_9AGAR|nr:hypothetical protein FB45DRAFT_945295 [Roridomyces roridus]